MRFIRSFLSFIIFWPLFFSCTNNTISGKTPTKPLCRALEANELAQYQDAFSHFFDSLLLRSGFSGGILVAKNGQVLYEQYRGFSDVEKAEPVSPNTPFHVASTSKTFTSTAILQLVQAGKMNLDDSLQKFFPLFPYQGITVRNLLNHSSGIPYYINLFEKYKWDKKKIATNADILYLLYAQRPPLEFTTGSRFRYCNTNFALLALIVEKVSGTFFPDYVKDSIFTKCGMTNSYIVSQNNPQDFLPSWSPGNRTYGFDCYDGIYGDKNVFTTCRDLLKYDSSIREHVLLNEGLYEQAWKPNFQDNHYHDSMEYYGLGWRLKVFPDSLKIAYHNGWWHGNNSVFQHVMADTAVVIVTGNHFTKRIYMASRAVNVFRPYYNRGHVDSEAPTELDEAGQKSNEEVPAVTSVKKKSTASAKKKPVKSSAKKKPAAKKRRR